MMTIDEIRRENLLSLIAECGGTKALAEKIGKSDAQVSQWANASVDSKTKRPRGISDDVCRHIEVSCGKVRGWMDNPKGSTESGNVRADDLAQLITLFGQSDEIGRQSILDAAHSTSKAGIAHPGVATNNQR
jgi:DNA-binding transcriptional regulator YdaS (Cro superfamily)